MSKADDVRDERQRATHINQRNASLHALGLGREGIATLAQLLRADATFIGEQRRKGWQTLARQHREAADLIGFWVEHYQPPAASAGPNPHREPLDQIRPAQFAGSMQTLADAPGDSVAEKLASLPDVTGTISGLFDAAPSGETLVTMTGTIDPDSVKREPLVHITANGLHERFSLPRDAITVCKAPAPALRTYRGGANCPDCIAVFDAEESSVIEPVAALPQPTFVEPVAPPKRMTFAEVRKHGMARQRGADHRSYSQLSAYKECGVRYAIDDLNRVPAWWNVGGTAVHYACEQISRDAREIQEGATLRDGQLQASADLDALWQVSLGRAISEAVTESGTTPDQWQAAKKGAEGYDWWRVEGRHMLDRWTSRLTALYAEGWRIVDVEWSIPLSVLTSADQPLDIKVENILDLIMVRGDEREYMIVDMKSGAHQPETPDQLTQYGHALGQIAVPGARINGAYWMARTDELIEVVDLFARRARADLDSEYEMFDTAEKAGVYLPGKTVRDTFGCKSCPVRDLCPAGPR